jgi:hypothetical protein
MVFKFAVPIVLFAGLAGCGSIGAIGLPWKRERPVEQPAPLATTAVDPVQSGDLPPPPGAETSAVAGLPPETLDPSAQPLSPPAGTAMAAPTGSGVNGGIGRTDLLGGWTITTAGDSCQLFMTLTSWTGGYRASTRGCSSDLLKSISAWNLQGSQVVLAGQGGSPLVALASSGTNRFEGQANGQGVSFFR